MALLRCDFFSETLSLGTSMTVLLPQPAAPIGTPGRPGGGLPPVLYLLHGLSDDDTTWLRRTSIERYAAALGLAVVMPQVHRSYYTDEASGGRYWTFLTEELPELVGAMFRVSQRREHTFVAGLSMGGYGALKWALRQPGRFAAAASLSGAVDVTALRSRRAREGDSRMFDRIFGPNGVPAGGDLLALVREADERDLPALYVCCGTEDGLIADNHAFRDACAEFKVPLDTSFTTGAHDWGYWDNKIQDVLAWLPLGSE